MSETVRSWRERLTTRGGLVSREDLRAVLGLLWPGDHEKGAGWVQPAGDLGDGDRKRTEYVGKAGEA